MSDILKDLSAPALIKAIKANPVEWWRYLGRSPKAEWHDSPEITWLLTGIPEWSVNVVIRTQVEPQDVDALIERTVAHFESKDMTRFTWRTGSDTQPADLGKHLIDHGWTYPEGTPGMAVDLSELNEDLPTPSGLTIEHVRDAEALRKWAYATIIGFGLPESSVKTWFDVFTGLGFDLPLRNYVGLLDGKPVAASELFLGAGVAGIYAVTTLPEARRQGIGAAITLAPLRDARAMGFRIGILHASSLGEGVYRRLGFQEYCKGRSYVHG